MKAASPTTGDDAQGKPTTKVDQSPRPVEGLRAWDFIKVGLAFDLIIAALIFLVSLGNMSPDTVPVGFAVFVLVSIAIWVGLGVVAVPTLLVQRMRRSWVLRRSKRRASLHGTWDDWIDGPRPV